ncbi:MAG: UpxY family transcription antiterminator [Flavobacterium sp.]|nr:MAG: UpxY family transcription antiterminator [Flavobacterium sp.]
MTWFVLYTNPKAEKKVAQQLAGMGIEVYCPLVIKERQWSDRIKKVEMPLFTSYVFVHIDDKNRNDVFNVKGVVRYLFWLGKPAIVRNEEIESIKKWLNETVTDVELQEIKKGDVFDIKDGPFKDHSGLVQQVNKSTVRLLIESIGMLITIRYTEA